MSLMHCRLCALQCEKLVNIYASENSNMELDAKIASCLQILISEEDILPKSVCLTCCTKLQKSFDFLETSTKAQALLCEIYEIQSKNIKDEKINSNVEFPNSLQFEQTECNDNAGLVNDEALIQEDIKFEPDIRCSELDLTNESEKIPVIEISQITVDIDDDVSNEVINLIDEEKEKSSHQEKNPNLNEVPDNPPITHLLEYYSWPCTICSNLTMNSVQDLKDHWQREHQQPPKYMCITCERQYDHYYSFIRHIKLHSNPKRYSCDTCGKSFARKFTFQSHALVHTNEKPHVCHTCGKTFKNLSSLYIHEKVHLPEQMKEKYSCDVCNREFTKRHSLQDHKKIHTGERNFICDICGKSYVLNSSLNYHLLTHTDERNYVCSTCGKGFKTAQMLARHIPLHSEIKPHQCDVCGKKFRGRNTLRAHSRIHADSRPYSCEFCAKCFRTKADLKVHIRQHTGERPYACLECGRHFTNWANYNKHMKRIHHCDMSSRKKNTQHPSADNVQPDGFNVKTRESVDLIVENKTNRRNTSQKLTSSTKPT